MENNEITKPSLTQRRKITGSGKVDEVYTPQSGFAEDEGSDDISIIKVGAVIAAVVVVAVVAAVLIINLQSSSGDNNNDGSNSPSNTPTPTVVATVTTTPQVTAQPDNTDDGDNTNVTPTPTKLPTNDNDNVTDNSNTSGQAEQKITSGATGGVFKIRTYQWINATNYYEFNLPYEAISGSETKPNVTTSYNSAGDLVLTIDNIGQFSSCDYLNSNNSNMTYGNVNKVTCAKDGNKFIFTIDTLTKTNFKLSIDQREIGTQEEKVNAVVVQVNNK